MQTSSKEEALKAKMASLGIREADIRELFVLSSKKGGQKVNKTSACVYLKHLPTGIEVKCREARSQALNRFLARRILTSKIADTPEPPKFSEKIFCEEGRRLYDLPRPPGRRSPPATRSEAAPVAAPLRRASGVQKGFPWRSQRTE